MAFLRDMLILTLMLVLIATSIAQGPTTSISMPPTSSAAPPTSVSRPPTSSAAPPTTSVSMPPTSSAAPPTTSVSMPPTSSAASVPPPTSSAAPPTSVSPPPMNLAIIKYTNMMEIPNYLSKPRFHGFHGFVPGSSPQPSPMDPASPGSSTASASNNNGAFVHGNSMVLSALLGGVAFLFV